MSKVVRLNDLVLGNLDKVRDYMLENMFQDDSEAWHLVFDSADENFFLNYVLFDYMEKRGISFDE